MAGLSGWIIDGGNEIGALLERKFKVLGSRMTLMLITCMCGYVHTWSLGFISSWMYVSLFRLCVCIYQSVT